MLYREAGQFKSTYAEDQRIFPIRQDRIAFWLLMLVASSWCRSSETSTGSARSSRRS